MREGFQIQVAIYVRMLKELLSDISSELKASGVDCKYKLNEKNGSVWNKGDILIRPENEYANREYKGEVEHELKERKFNLAQAFDEIDGFLKEVRNSYEWKTGNRKKEWIVKDVDCITSPDCAYCTFKDVCISFRDRRGILL